MRYYRFENVKVFLAILCIVLLTGSIVAYKSSDAGVYSSYPNGINEHNFILNESEPVPDVERVATELNCDLFITGEEVDVDTTEIILNLKSHIKNFIEPEVLVDWIIYRTGLDFRLARAKLLPDQQQYKGPKYVNKNYSRNSLEEEQLLYNYLTNKDSVGLFQKFIEGTIDQDKFYYYKKFNVFLLELIILSDIDKAEELLLNLVEAGFPVRDSDITAAISNNLSKNTIQVLFKKSDININKKLNYHSQNRSFMTYALHSQSYNLIKYFYENGSSPEPDVFYPNSLDILALKNDSYSSGELDDLFRLLTTANIFYNKEETYSLLKSVITEEVFQNSKFVELKYFEAFDKTPNTNLTKAIHNIYKNILVGVASDELFKLPNTDCIDLLGKNILATVLDLELKKDLIAESGTISFVEDMEKKIEIARNLHTSTLLVKEYLGGNQFLSEKRSVDYYIKKLAEEELERALQNSQPSKIDILKHENLEKVYALARSGEWNSARKMLHRLEINRTEAMTALVVIALNMNTELAVVEELLRDGAKVEHGFMHLLIYKNDLKMANLFLDYGLDVRHVHPGDETPVMIAVKFQKYEMAVWLFEKGATANSEGFGFDALDFALSQDSNTSQKLKYVSLLINNGSSIEASHRQLVDRLFNENMAQFSALIREFPQLGGG
jgi:hypothetical protein